MSDFDRHAEQVAAIARQYAYRRRHNIEHTGHTVHRLLEAVSALLGERVDLTRIPPPTRGRAASDQAYAPVQPRP